MTVDKAAATAAVLDEMVAGIMGTKAEKAAKLTPVGLEGVQATPLRQQFSPLESPYTGLEDACRTIRAGIAQLEKYLSAIERDAKAITANTQGHAKRDELDEAWETPIAPVEETFPDRMKRLSAEAQASAFVTLDESPVAAAPTTWTCPQHGGEDVREKKSPKKRIYAICGVPNCKEFSK